MKSKKAMAILALAAALLLAGCGGNAMTTTAKAAAAAPALAQQLNQVYAFLVAQKAIPDHTAEATKALAALDAIAPMVQQGDEALQGDKINWAQFVLQAALTTAQVFGYVAAII